MTRHIPIGLALILSLAGFANAAAPKVVITSPDNGEIDVDPDMKEIRIEFDRPMDARGRSILGGGESFPEISGELKWLDDRTLIIPVTLKPDHPYQLSINSDTFKGFCGKSGQPAEWYPVRFRTRAAGGVNGVTVYLPSWEDQLPDGTLLEGRGVRPDIIIKTTLRDLEKSDAVLEAALKFLRVDARARASKSEGQ